MWRNFGTCAKIEQVSNQSEYVLDEQVTMMCAELDEQVNLPEYRDMNQEQERSPHPHLLLIC